jgi:hypothetical protein
MNRIVASLLFSCLCSPLWAYQELRLSFYTETVRLVYDQPLAQVPSPAVEERSIRQFYLRQKEQPPSTLLHSLQKTRRTLRLNDWLYYELILKTLHALLPEGNKNDKTFWAWVLLSQTGFDTRLAYLGQEVFLYVYTQDRIYEAPVIQDDGRSYVNLTAIPDGPQEQRALYLLDLPQSNSGHAFSFRLRELPLLRPIIEERQVKFRYKDEQYEWTVKVDRNIANFMDGYPILSEASYLETPLSDSLAQSLYPHLKKLAAGKNEWQTAELLAAFTRSAFVYKEDKEYFGKSKPMVAEELLLYPYSDCEDRTAMFFNLVQEVLGLPALLVAYPDHLTMAIALPQSKGSRIRYEGKDYYICDPTGPANSHEIGIVPKGYESVPFSILKSYP